MLMNNAVKRGIVLDPADNVCTLVSDADAGDSINLNDGPEPVTLAETAGFGHKVAVRPVIEGEAVIKYGQRIGVALCDIQPGEWVHLHNMKSIVDPDFKRKLVL